MDASSFLYDYLDYLVFALLILASFSVAFYGRFSGPKEKTKQDYAFALNRSVSMPAMMLSIARGFLGVRVFLGYPSELFYRGSAMWETLIGMVIAFPLVLYFFVPVYYSLGITSVYQYLDLRFKSRLVRCLASGTYVLRSILNLGVTVFTPCVALKTVIGMPYWVSITSIVAISIFFTMLGGLRTAIITDVAQLLVMMGCSIAIIFQGTISAGGVANVYNTSLSQGRLDFFNFDLDPTIRVTTVSAVLGQMFMSLSIFGCQQNFVQRYCSMSSESKVKKTLWANVPIMTILFSLNWIVGMVIFANYVNCDPKGLGLISDIDEILPFYVEDKFYYIPGMLGVVMASLFNGSLSLMFSNLNSLAIVMAEDFIFQIPLFKGMTEKAQLWSIKILAALCGIWIMGVAFLVAHLSGVIEASMLMTSATSGPLLGVFILAMFFPPANWKGAATGMICSHVIVLWITFGSLMMDKPSIPQLPTSIDGCTNTTFSPHIPTPLPAPSSIDLFFDDLDDIDDQGPVVGPAHDDNDFLEYLYSITYMYYSLIGTLITVLIGIIISYITASEEDSYDETLVSPWARKFCKLLPGKQRYFVSGHDQSTITSNGTHCRTSDKQSTEKYKQSALN